MTPTDWLKSAMDYRDSKGAALSDRAFALASRWAADPSKCPVQVSASIGKSASHARRAFRELKAAKLVGDGLLADLLSHLPPPPVTSATSPTMTGSSPQRAPARKRAPEQDVFVLSGVLPQTPLSERECPNGHLSDSPPASPDAFALTPDEPKPPTEDDQIREVLEYWRDKTGRTSRCNIGKGTRRWTRVRARIRQGFTVSALKTAVRGAMLDEWYSSRGLLEVSNIFLDEERVEKLVNVAVAQRAKRDRERAEQEYQEAMAQPASPDPMVLDFLKEMASK